MMDGMYVIVILIIAQLCPYVQTTCTFPSNLEGTWDSPEKGTLVINSTTISGYDIDTYTDLTFTCEASSGSYYAIRYGSFSLLSNSVDFVLCLDLTEEATDKYSYYILTAENPSFNNERAQVISATSTGLTTTDMCNATLSNALEVKLLVRAGASVSSLKVQCPDVFLATMYYTSHGTCTQSQWDVCSALTDMNIDYTLCSDIQAYSAAGIVYCILSKTSGSVGITYVYNSDSTVDGSTTYRYTCLVAESALGVIVMSQHPTYCYKNQSGSYAPSPGKVMSFGANVPSSSSSSSSSTSNVGLIAGLTVAFLLIIPAAIVGAYFLYTKKFKSVAPEHGNAFQSETPVRHSQTHNTGASHGKLVNVLGPEYAMSQEGGSAKDNIALQDIEKPSNKLEPLNSTGVTPRDIEGANELPQKHHLPPIQHN